MKRLTTFATMSAVLVLGLVLGARSASANEPSPGPEPGTVHVKKLTYGGSGCPAGTATYNLADDAKSFTFIFDAFLAQIGPGIPLAESRKNCQVNLVLNVPPGFSYGIASVDYRGYANIAPGSTGQQRSSYYFQGQSPTVRVWSTFAGSATDFDWQTHDEVQYASIVFSPCGVERAVNINAEIRLNKGQAPASASSIIAMDSEDVEFRQLYHFEWQTCSTAP